MIFEKGKFWLKKITDFRIIKLPSETVRIHSETFARESRITEEAADLTKSYAIESAGDSRCHSCKIAGHARPRPHRAMCMIKSRRH